MFSFFIVQAIACHDLIMNYNPGDSVTFQIHIDQVGGNYERPKVMARRVIKEVFKKVQCDEDISLDQVQCSRIIPSKSHTTICYAEYPSGYFFVTRDFVDHYIAIYNRFD